MRSDFSLRGDHQSHDHDLGDGDTVHAAAQKAAEDRIMTGLVHETIKSSYRITARFTTEGSQHPGDLLEPRLLLLDNPTG
jgi:hypothetical protein